MTQKLERSATLNFQLLSKNVLTADEMEQYELAQLAGVVMDPSVFKIIIDLLKMNVSPTAVLQMLKSMCVGSRKKVLQSEDLALQQRHKQPSRGRIASGSGSKRTESRR
ncbi:hypothetical protein CHS0354_024396 [Potamilus streckersoni]|uniref:Mitotic-spindle organizing protein 2 n=1 Tax=Potamilus streckersoni TaxID=2493646 RepID=A0AAE0W3N4_9BIVA|nr:hypothetical protein CHS0354_024396 [Potamilus streckersoni]